MSIKNELLEIAFAIYEREVGKTWFVDEDKYDVSPDREWKAPDMPLKLEGVTFCKRNGIPIRVELAKFVRVDEDDMSLTVATYDQDEHYENDFIKEYFYEPFTAYNIHENALSVESLRKSQVA